MMHVDACARIYTPLPMAEWPNQLLCIRRLYPLTLLLASCVLLQNGQTDETARSSAAVRGFHQRSDSAETPWADGISGEQSMTQLSRRFADGVLRAVFCLFFFHRAAFHFVVVLCLKSRFLVRIPNKYCGTSHTTACLLYTPRGSRISFTDEECCVGSSAFLEAHV